MRTLKDFPKETHYLFRRPQVLVVDLQEFLLRYEPARLSPFGLRNLFGRVSIEVESSVEYGDLAIIPQTRTLIGPCISPGRGLGFS